MLRQFFAIALTAGLFAQPLTAAAQESAFSSALRSAQETAQTIGDKVAALDVDTAELWLELGTYQSLLLSLQHGVAVADLLGIKNAEPTSIPLYLVTALGSFRLVRAANILAGGVVTRITPSGERQRVWAQEYRQLQQAEGQAQRAFQAGTGDAAARDAATAALRQHLMGRPGVFYKSMRLVRSGLLTITSLAAFYASYMGLQDSIILYMGRDKIDDVIATTEARITELKHALHAAGQL